MREIKFKGKRIDNGEWVYGDLTRYSHQMSYITVDLVEGEIYQVYTSTVGQFTGLLDKNSKEIYEGDILNIKFHNWHKPGDVIASGKEKVFFNSGKFGFLWGSYREFTTMDGFASTTTFEVIGNALDNPELLEVTE